MVAVYTPNTNITACELTSYGRHVMLALEDHEQLVTLQLKGPGISDSNGAIDEYGEKENNSKVYDMKDVELSTGT